MKNRVLILGLATVLSGALPAQAKLNVVATLPISAQSLRPSAVKVKVTSIARWHGRPAFR